MTLDTIFADFDHDPTFDKPAPQPKPTIHDAHDQPASFRGQFTDAASALRYISGGNATVTLQSKKTGARFTFSVRAPTDKVTGKRDGSGTLFVGLLNGPDNETNYKYLGRITAEGHFWIGRKNPRPGDLDRNAPSAKAFDWTWKNLNRGIFGDQLEIWHESKCGRCGRKLTVPASIASGFGPECINHI